MESVAELYGDHMEADTRVMLHARHADMNDPGNIIVRANDTDIFIVLLANVPVLRFSHHWYDSGLDGNNTRQYTDITQLSEAVDNKEALPGIYAFTGCDYTPFFFRKGKGSPLKLMAKYERFIDAFSSLGSESLSTQVFDTLEEFTCMMYGQRQHKHVNDALTAHFDKKCKPSRTGKPFASIKSVDPTTFMPCLRVLYEHIKRAWYIAHLYKTASEKYPAASFTPIDFGWKLTDSKDFLCINWFEGDQVPQEFDQIEGCYCDDDDDNDDDEEDGAETDGISDDEEDGQMESDTDEN